MTSLLLTFWLIPAILFLGVSFMVRRRMLLPTMALNVIFLCFAYISESQMLSNAKPVFQKIPFYTHGNWSGNGVKVLFSQTKGKANTYLLVEENDVPRLYNLPYDPKMADALKRAGKHGRIIMSDSKTEMSSVGDLKVQGLPESDFEPKSETEGNVEDYN